MTVLLVGEDNPLSSAPEHALYPWPHGCAGHRLCTKILGMRPDDYLGLYRTNLCGGSWSTKEARGRVRVQGRVLHDEADVRGLVRHPRHATVDPRVPAASERSEPDLEPAGQGLACPRVAQAGRARRVVGAAVSMRPKDPSPADKRKAKRREVAREQSREEWTTACPVSTQ